MGVTPELSVRPDLLLRFHERVDRSAGPKGCWEWTAGKTAAGYGELFTGNRDGAQGRVVLAHRVAWSLTNGPIPPGLTIDHLCRVKSCCNPAHLEAVTQRTNILRSDCQSALNARKTHCKHGHPFSTENTLIRADGRRICKACDRIRRGYQRPPDRPSTATLRSLRSLGWSYRQIGDEVGMSHAAVRERLVAQ